MDSLSSRVTFVGRSQAKVPQLKRAPNTPAAVCAHHSNTVFIPPAREVS